MFISHMSMHMFTEMLVMPVLYERVLQTQQCQDLRSLCHGLQARGEGVTGHFRAALNLIMKARLSAFFIRMQNKTNFHIKSFPLSVAFITRFTAEKASKVVIHGLFVCKGVINL